MFITYSLDNEIFVNSGAQKIFAKENECYFFILKSSLHIDFKTLRIYSHAESFDPSGRGTLFPTSITTARNFNVWWLYGSVHC